MANAKNGRKRRLNITLLVFIILIIAVIVEQQHQKELENPKIPNDYTEVNLSGELKLHMIDVGQADCFLFIQGDKAALVDCGTRTTGKEAVKYIKGLGITKLDYVFGTHPHDDHMGGMYDIITNFEIGNIILPKVEAGQVTTNWYIKLMKEIADGNYTVEYSKTGNEYQLGDATMEILWQSEGTQNNVNNYSNIIKISFGDMDVLMTGDAETEIEEEVLRSEAEIDAEILKVGHHGSDTSTSEEFLNQVDPDYGLISCNVGNKYEHPTKSTMEKLQQREVEVYRTDECGTVIATITAKNVTFNSKIGDYLSGPELEEVKKAS